ncbi:MAG: phage virion morphogenesis protein [Fibromonadales bacterium]|nr:phage virion morphogenesis protein [Fibromonadales bacterium]
MKLSIKTDAKPLLKLFKGVADGIKSQEQAMKLTGDYVVKSVRENFLQGGRPNKWAPNSPVTLAMKLGKSKGKARAKKAATNKVLVGLGMRGGLMGGIHYKANANEVVIQPDKKPYAAIHQFGGMAGRNRKVKIPARPYLVLQPGDIPKIQQIISKEIGKMIGGLVAKS